MIGGQYGDAAAVSRAVGDAGAVIVIIRGGLRESHRITDVARTVIEAMRAAGARRLIVTSAYPIVTGGAGLPWFLRRLLATPYADGRGMERVVSSSGLDWTIVRFNRLTDGARTGRVQVSDGPLAEPEGHSRADGASVLLDMAESARFIGQAVNVTGT